MPVILLAHRDPQVRASLGSALTARGFEVLGVDSVDSALDAAAAGATAMLVELALLADEDLEVKTRLDLRSGRPVRILVLTHRASSEEMSMMKRHGAGLLSRPVEDVERMAKMLNIVEEAPAPWEGSTSATPPSKPGGKAPARTSPPAAPTPPPRSTMAPTPAPRATIAPAPAPVPQPPVAATPPPPVSPPASASSTFKPPPSNFMPPDLSKSFAAAPPPVSVAPPPPVTLAPPPPSPPMPPAGAAEVSPSIAEILEEERFDDAATAIGAPMMPAPAPLDESPPVPVAPAPPPPAGSASLWGDDTENDIDRPRMNTNVFLDEPEEATNKVPVPGEGLSKADPLPTAGGNDGDEIIARTSVSPPKAKPNVFVEAEEGSTGAFAIPARAADSLAPDNAPPPPDAAPPPPAFAPPPIAAPPIPVPILEERTQVIPDLAESAIPAKPSANPFESETSPGVPDSSNISASVSNAWFSESEEGEPQKPTGSGPSVLVVDDEPAFRMFLKEALGSQGYQVHTAINGPNALRFVKTQPPVDLVIADLHMPHMDGFELKHEIDRVLGRSMPFIVCTADANEEKIETAAHVGAAALVPKPIENLDAFFAIVIDTLKDAGVIARTATS